MRARFLVVVSVGWLACGRTTSPPTPSDDGGGGPTDAGIDADLTCDEQQSETQTAIDDAIAQLVASPANVSCTQDSDCVIVPLDTACTASCGGQILNQVGAAQLAADVAKISAATCASYATDGCLSPSLPPCPPSRGPVSCLSGTCGFSTAQPCLFDGGAWYCAGLGTYPACPTGADGPGGSPSSCRYDGGCFVCNEQAFASETCACGGDGGTEWECSSAERGCYE